MTDSKMINPYSAALQPYSKSFSPEVLLAEAQAATGLDDWGGKRWDEERFRHNLQALCLGLEETAQLTALGRSRMHSRVFTMLTSRLRYLDARKSTAGVEQEAIMRPLVGTGLGRAGTTFLHGILAADPGNKVVRAYEAAMPAPLLVKNQDIRPDLYQQILLFGGQALPHVWEIHPFGANLPEECIFIQEGSCCGLYGVYAEMPAFHQAVADHAAIAYRYQKGVMQYLQALDPGKRWLLKAPGHLFTWDEFLMAFPDARIYVNHRDPGRSIPSLASLFHALRELHSGAAVDPLLLGPAQIAMWDGALNGYARWRIGPGRDTEVFDIEYGRLVSAPIETVRDLYDRFELPMTAAARDAMERHLEADHHGKGSKRQYTLAQFGIDEEMIERTFGDYIDQFGIAREMRN